MFFFFQAEDGIRDRNVTGVQTCALPIYCVELRQHVGGRKARLRVVADALARWLRTDQDARAELHTFLAHLLEAAVDGALLELEVRDAVAKQAADAVALLEDRYVVAGARELLRAGEPRRPGADHRHLLAGL